MTSESIYLKRIDELTRNYHPYLNLDDEVYYLGEYTVGEFSQYSKINQLIFNYKKPKERAEHSDWHYKEKAINETANLFRASILNTIVLSDRSRDATLVPIPPSMSKASPDYDDRNLRMLKSFMPSGDIRELILQNKCRTPLHVSKEAPRTAQELYNNYLLNEKQILPAPKELWLFDDILTKGTHYRAAHGFLKKVFPKVPIVGIFIARTIERKIQPGDHRGL